MPKLRPLHLGLLILALDAVWVSHAFSAVTRDNGSNVQLVSLIVWCTLHLPAAILGGLLVRPFGALDQGPQGLPIWALGVMAALGLAQAFGLAWGAAAWWQRRRRA